MKQLRDFWYQVWYEFCKSKGFTRVGSLSYTLLLSFVPCFISLVSIISLFPVSKRFMHYVEKFIFSNFLPKTGEIFYHDFSVNFLRFTHLSWFAIILLLLTVFATLRTLETHINEMWEIKKSRSIGYSAAVYTGLIAFGPLLLCASIFLRLSYAKLHIQTYSYLNMTVLNILTYFISILLFTSVYKILPAIKVKFSLALTAGLIAATMFELSKRIFIFYVTNFPTYDVIYGSLAFVPLFLIWIYISTLILLFCAQVLHVLKLLENP